MRQYKIWNSIGTRGGRKSSCDYGANDSDRRTVYVGTSSRNSHEFAEIEVDRVTVGDRDVFRLYVDGALIKTGTLIDGALEIDHIA